MEVIEDALHLHQELFLLVPCISNIFIIRGLHKQMFILVTGMMVQLTTSSRRENGGAYREDVFGGKWMVSKGNYLFCVVVWSVLVNDEFLGQLEKSCTNQIP